MKINGGSFNMMKALNESAKDELEVKKQVLIESNKVTITEDEDKYKDMFINYCDGKIKNLGKITITDEELEESTEYDIILHADGLREFNDVRIIRDPEDEDGLLKVIDNKGNLVIDGGMITDIEYVSRLEFDQIDEDYYNEILELWDDIDMDYFFKENEKLTEACFDDRVKAIKKSLKKKDKRLSDKSAETSAKKIAGSMKEDSLTEGDYDYVKDKRNIVIALEGLKEDLLKLPNVTKVEFDTSLYADNIPGPITLVFYDIKESGSEYFKAKDLLLKRILSVMEINGVNIEKEETEDNDTYFYFVAYSTNWNKEPIEETSMEEIRQDSADKGLLEPEVVNEEDEDSQIWNKIEEIVDTAERELEPTEGLEYKYDEHIKFVIYRDYEHSDMFEVYTYVDEKMQEDLDTGDVHIEDLDKVLVNIVKKLQDEELTEAVNEDLHEVKSQGNIYMLQDSDKYIVGENYDSKEKLIENAEIYNNKEEADKDYLNRCGIKID